MTQPNSYGSGQQHDPADQQPNLSYSSDDQWQSSQSQSQSQFESPSQSSEQAEQPYQQFATPRAQNEQPTQPMQQTQPTQPMPQQLSEQQTTQLHVQQSQQAQPGPSIPQTPYVQPGPSIPQTPYVQPTDNGQFSGMPQHTLLYPPAHQQAQYSPPMPSDQPFMANPSDGPFGHAGAPSEAANQSAPYGQPQQAYGQQSVYGQQQPAQQPSQQPIQSQPYGQQYTQPQSYGQQPAYPAYSQQPYSGQPTYNGQPQSYNPQPYNPQPYNPQPYNPQPYGYAPQQYPGQPYGYNQPIMPHVSRRQMPTPPPANLKPPIPGLPLTTAVAAAPQPQMTPEFAARIEQTAKSRYTRASAAILTMLIVYVALVMLCSVFVSQMTLSDNAYVWVSELASFIPLYGIAMPLALLILSGIPQLQVQQSKLTGWQFTQFALMTFPIAYAGVFISNWLNLLLTDGRGTDALSESLGSNLLADFLFTVILAPIMEEWIFRKQLISRLRQFGEVTAIVFSALVFGLFHMNLFQFFYAFGLGLLFGYVFTRTNDVKYSIGLHMIVNFNGGLLTTVVYDSNSEMLQAIYILLLLAAIIAGFILFFKNRKQLFVFYQAPTQLPKGQGPRVSLLNAPIILFIIIAILMTIATLYAGIV